MVAAIELANLRSVELVAQELGIKTLRHVLDQLKDLREIYRDDILTDKTFEPTPVGEQLLAEWQDIVSRIRQSIAIRDQVTSVAYLPQHSDFVTEAQNLVVERNSSRKVKLKNLGEEGRSIGGFEERAVAELRRHIFSLTVGLRPHNAKGLNVESLYWARLEAMVPTSEGLDRIELEDLIKRDLCVAPIDTRSRKNLEDKITALKIDDPDPDGRILLETVGTKGLIIHAVRTRIAKHPTVVIPSDVAHPFRPGQPMAGPWSEKWTWIPVLARGDEIQHEVFVSTVEDQSPATQEMVAALFEAVRDMDIGVEPRPPVGSQSS
jgi:hypothetical protein